MQEDVPYCVRKTKVFGILSRFYRLKRNEIGNRKLNPRVITSTIVFIMAFVCRTDVAGCSQFISKPAQSVWLIAIGARRHGFL
jgi:hypothetical protein